MLHDDVGVGSPAKDSTSRVEAYINSSSILLWDLSAMLELSRYVMWSLKLKLIEELYLFKDNFRQCFDTCIELDSDLLSSIRGITLLEDDNLFILCMFIFIKIYSLFYYTTESSIRDSESLLDYFVVLTLALPLICRPKACWGL